MVCLILGGGQTLGLWYASYSVGVRLWEDSTGDAIKALHNKLTAIIQRQTAKACTESHERPLYEEHATVLIHPEGGYWQTIVATAAGSALMFMRVRLLTSKHPNPTHANMENSTVRSLTQRMVDGTLTEYATPYSGAYDALDKALGDKLDRMVATSRSELSTKNVMLVTEDVGNNTLCLLERAFPAYTKIHHILHTTLAGDVEAMQSCLVHDLFQREAKNLKAIHVGGYANMHVLYGRSVHLETPAMTIMEILRGMRRDSNLEQLFRDYGNLFSKMPKGHMSWEPFYEFESRRPNCSVCVYVSAQLRDCRRYY
ncbi:hypothetical protein O181_092679, partial [Austropuccinia psidii MF-1]|nr:hypothetical protein [Austropuccinia psidii MF-1]